MTREETRIFVAPVVRCFPIDIILLISRYIDTQIWRHFDVPSFFTENTDFPSSSLKIGPIDISVISSENVRFQSTNFAMQIPKTE